jgi:uncharacterized Zn finger protein (UPF0148 family)
MDELDSVIDSRELDVDCRRCGWRGERPLAWLRAQRDMNCPACRSVIVLNTSERRRQMAAVRRQVEALHRQLSDTIPSAAGMMTGRESGHTSTTTHLQLSLMVVYRDSARRRADVSSRRTARTKR